ncbi:MAG: hypothetical protein ACAI34_04010 [Verrucomicrobium sp.]
MPTITYLRRANDDLISFCTCGDGRVTFPSQMNCPWCGCGWLFTCITCGKAFTIAEGVKLDTTWEQLAAEDLKGRWKDEPVEEDIEVWIGVMKGTLADIVPGKKYVILDGNVLPVDARDVVFDGWHAHHEFETLPHAQALALNDASVLDIQLGSMEYWQTQALPDE